MAAAASPAPSAGPAHVATVSFLTSRAAPAGGFWIALAGGVALARVAQRLGARQGFGASLAAMLETVAIMGPARFGVPLTQAVSAPLLGRLEARGVGPLAQILACGLIRLLHNAATTAFFIWVVTGGLDAYAGTYDALGRRVGIEVGTADALVATGVGLLAWAAFASTMQVLVYRRGLHSWPEGDRAGAPDRPGGDALGHRPGGDRPDRPGGQALGDRPGDNALGHRRSAGRFDPRLVAAAAAVAFALLLISTAWALLAAVALWLVLAWALSRPDPAPLPTGLALAALLGAGALLFTLGGGLGLDVALRRTLRAVLLVLVATWLRAAAGADGLREVSRRVLGRLKRLPALPEAASTLGQIGSEGRLRSAGLSLSEALKGVRKRPLPFADAVLAWVAKESARFNPDSPAPPRALRARVTDWALLAAAVSPAAALVL